MDETGVWRERFVGSYPTHRLAFFGGMASMFVVDVVLLPGWSTFYPMLVWTVVLSVHFLVYRSLTVDARWVDERVEKVGYQPWDTGHIQEIRKNPYGRSPYRTEEGRVDPPPERSKRR